MLSFWCVRYGGHLADGPRRVTRRATGGWNAGLACIGTRVVPAPLCETAGVVQPCRQAVHQLPIGN